MPYRILFLILLIMLSSCNTVTQNIEVYETSESGNKMTERTEFV